MVLPREMQAARNPKTTGPSPRVEPKCGREQVPGRRPPTLRSKTMRSLVWEYLAATRPRRYEGHFVSHPDSFHYSVSSMGAVEIGRPNLARSSGCGVASPWITRSRHLAERG
jgi:hypothetical protein